MRRTSPLRLLAIALLLSALGIPAASAAVKDRITAAVSGSSRVAIPNSVHGKVRLATDLGPVAADTKLTGMTLRFSLTAAQQAALDQLLLDQQNPASPSYHQWLTPAQYAAQFGLSSSDIAKVSAWLTSQGFTITEVAKTGTFIRFDGTAAQAQTAFATSIHSLSLNGETHFANVTDAAVPSAFSGVVGGITGLHNFRLKPRLRTSVVASPQFTSSVSGNHYIAPGDFYTIYHETSLLNNSINGTGVMIAIMGQTDIIPTDISSFRSAAGLSVNAPSVTLYGCDPGIYSSQTSANTTCNEGYPPTSDDLQESSLDLEWSGAVAPSANIIFVNSNDVFDVSLTDAIDNDIAPIMSISYGDCEASWGTSYLNTFNQLFKQANAMGISVVAPAADYGAADCDEGEVVATQGLAVDFPASSPYVTGMGGTMFNEGTALGATPYWNSSTTSDIISSAISYIPEAVWNENEADETFSAGGGGASNFFSKPAWQQGTGVPADASRDVPDLALNSAPSHDGYLYCVQGSCVVGFRESAGGGFNVVGGTSVAAPSFAGILALAEQKIGARIGNANPTIYALANDIAYYTPGATTTNNSNVVFNDVTTGNNDDPCTAGDPNCPNGGNIGYNAGLGYDPATGWGSVNAYNLVTDWNLVTPLGIGSLGPNVSATAVSTPSSSVVAGATVTLTAIVTGSIPTLTNGVLTLTPDSTLPTGAVQFLLNNTALGTPATLSTASGVSVATYAYVTSCSSLGQQVFAASYSGDSNYAGSKGAGITTQGFVNQFSTVTPVEVQVTSGTCPDFSMTAPTPPTVTSGSPSVVVTVTPVNGFTGTVVFSASAIESSSVSPSFSFSPSSVTITSAASATTTLTLSNITAALHTPAAPGKPDSRTPWYAGGSGLALASLLCFILPRKRRLGGLLLVALSFVMLGGAIGCSSGNTTITASTNSDVGEYAVTIIGTYTSSTNVVSSHSVPVTFYVQ